MKSLFLSLLLLSPLAAIRSNGSFNLPSEETTFAEITVNAGYSPAMIGKSPPSTSLDLFFGV